MSPSVGFVFSVSQYIICYLQLFGSEGKGVYLSEHDGDPHRFPISAAV